MKARLYVDIKFSKRATDAEGLAVALDNVMDVGMSALGDSWGEYGGAPQVGKFFVLDSEQAIRHADDLDKLIDGQDDELGKSLAPVRDFLRKVAEKK
jgi:hypothetical protein